MCQGAVDLDWSLARLQALCVDAIGPLATFLELAEQDQLTAEGVVSLTKLELRLCQMLQCRYHVKEESGQLKRDSKLVEQDSIYEKAAPMLLW